MGRLSVFQESSMEDDAPVVDGLPPEDVSLAFSAQETIEETMSTTGCRPMGQQNQSNVPPSSSDLVGGISNKRQSRLERPASVIFAAPSFISRNKSAKQNKQRNRLSLSHLFTADNSSDSSGTLLDAGILSSSKRRPLSGLFGSFNLKRSFSISQCLSKSQETNAKPKLQIVEQPTGIFGVPLRQSITYANVAISLVDAEGKSYIYGYVPIVVAKCGVYLKEKGMLLQLFGFFGSILTAPESYKR
jgi:hypothetical protein